MVAHVPWATSPDRRSKWIWTGAALAGVMMFGLALAWFAWRRSGAGPTRSQSAIAGPRSRDGRTGADAAPSGIHRPFNRRRHGPTRTPADPPPSAGRPRPPSASADIRSPGPELADTEDPPAPVPAPTPGAGGERRAPCSMKFFCRRSANATATWWRCSTTASSARATPRRHCVLRIDAAR